MIVTPTVSVIIPCYNLAAFLPEALNSVLNQQYQDWECIVADDNSSDDSVEIASRYAEKDSRFHILPSDQRGGVSRARNRGVEASKGRYLLFLDADDILLPHYMEKAVRILDNNNQVTIVSGQAEQFGEGVVTRKKDLPPFSMEQLIAQNCVYITSFIRRTAFDKAGGFCESFASGWEDWDFWLSALHDDSEMRMLDEIVFRYRLRKDSRNHSIPIEDFRTIRRLIWERHKDLYAKYFFDPTLSGEYARAKHYWKKYERFPGVRLYRFITEHIRKWLHLW